MHKKIVETNGLPKDSSVALVLEITTCIEGIEVSPGSYARLTRN